MRGEQTSRGGPDLDPRSKSEDFSLRPDPTGARDPLGHTHLDDTVDDVSDRVEDAASTVGVRASELADKAVTRVADLAGDARDFASDKVDAVRDKASGAYEDARTWVADTHDEQRRRVTHLARRGQARIDHGRNQVGDFVEENPLLVGVVGIAAGLLLGALIPRTRSEDRSIGPYADELRAQGMQYAREATHRGRAFVENALDPDNLNAAAEQAAHPSAQDDRLHKL